MRRVIAVLASCVAVGCAGFGAPIVGERPIEDLERDGTCDIGPSCEPVRALPSDHFALPEAPGPSDDCDLDGIPDFDDACPGHPSLAGDGSECAAAERACAQLARGEGSFVGADLRGCEAEVAISPAQSFADADLRCARLRFVTADVETEWGPADALALAGASLTDASLTVDGPVRVEAPGLTLRRSTLRLEEGATLDARGAVLHEARLEVAAPTRLADAELRPALDLTGAEIVDSVVYEATSDRAGRVRLDSARIETSYVSAPAVDLIGASLTDVRLAGQQLVALGAQLVRTDIDVEYGAFANVLLAGATFAQCEELTFSNSDLQNVDIAACPPDQLRMVATNVVGARIGGGLDSIDGVVRVSTVGGETLSTFGTDFETTRFCGQRSAVFIGGDLRCVRCAQEEFSGGDAVCLAGTRVVERGCQQIELAPECDPAIVELAVQRARP
ncbi:MAG: pentapeptide repeat-containing protein [Sandaracinaceae bacterium]